MYRFCNLGHCFDFNPNKKLHVNPAKPPVNNLEYYQDRVRKANNKAVYIIDDNGIQLDTNKPIWPKNGG